MAQYQPNHQPKNHATCGVCKSRQRFKSRLVNYLMDVFERDPQKAVTIGEAVFLVNPDLREA